MVESIGIMYTYLNSLCDKIQRYNDPYRSIKVISWNKPTVELQWHEVTPSWKTKG